jgi:inosine/xanthosine triphosphate pyrophosphatase family protein
MINFLTSNQKKAADFKSFGFGVVEFPEEVPEVKSINVQEVALYKAKDTRLNNIVVEDTALYVEDSHFLGTEIKHVYSDIQENSEYNNHEAIWKICLCMKKDDIYYLSVGELKGILKYPCAPEGYHFEKLFSVRRGKKYVHFSTLSEEEQKELSPRMQALRKLKYAVMNNDFSELIQTSESEIKVWNGEYQIERQ